MHFWADCNILKSWNHQTTGNVQLNSQNYNKTLIDYWSKRRIKIYSWDLYSLGMLVMCGVAGFPVFEICFLVTVYEIIVSNVLDVTYRAVNSSGLQ